MNGNEFTFFHFSLMYTVPYATITLFILYRNYTKAKVIKRNQFE